MDRWDIFLEKLCDGLGSVFLLAAVIASMVIVGLFGGLFLKLVFTMIVR